MKKVWFVSRQNYSSLGEDALVVEIAYGGQDYCNPGMLVKKYDGEGEEYADPVEAARVAMLIAGRWSVHAGKEISVRHGCTGGNSIPFSEIDHEDIWEWAQAAAEQLPRCAQCCAVLADEKWYVADCYNDPDFACCSEYCAERCVAETEEDS